MNWIVAHWAELLAAIQGVIGAIILIALLLPGPEPEATLQKILDFIAKFSVKPSESSDKS